MRAVFEALKEYTAALEECRQLEAEHRNIETTITELNIKLMRSRGRIYESQARLAHAHRSLDAHLMQTDSQE